MQTSSKGLDVALARSRFPALQRRPDAVFVDSPGGTQVPREVITAMGAYLEHSNANSGGAFPTSAATDEVIAGARQAGADFLGCSPDEIAFGPNMTTLCFSLSRAVGRSLKRGDEVVVTRLDHDANVAPWVAAARDAGAVIRWVDVDELDCTLDLTSLERALSPQTRVVAFTLASNATGTITAARRIVALARSTEALIVADAVHLAPHCLIDVTSLGVDVLFCSPYKFFGPHLGLLYGRRAILENLHPYKVRPASNAVPRRLETGTASHEALAGFTAAVDYVASLGGSGHADRRRALEAGMAAVRDHEAGLSACFLDALSHLEGVTLYGISQEERIGERTPTFALRISGTAPRAAAEALAAQGIYAWDGNYYALELMEWLGLEESGGALRIGFCHYNTVDEVERVAAELRGLTA